MISSLGLKVELVLASCLLKSQINKYEASPNEKISFLVSSMLGNISKNFSIFCYSFYVSHYNFLELYSLKWSPNIFLGILCKKYFLAMYNESYVDFLNFFREVFMCFSCSFPPSNLWSLTSIIWKMINVLTQRCS